MVGRDATKTLFAYIVELAFGGTILQGRFAAVECWILRGMCSSVCLDSCCIEVDSQSRIITPDETEAGSAGKQPAKG